MAGLVFEWLEGEGGLARSEVVRLTFFRVDPTSCGCDGDLDCDGLVGLQDVIRLLSGWGACDLCGADLDDDAIIGFQDLVALLAAWGGCP